MEVGFLGDLRNGDVGELDSRVILQDVLPRRVTVFIGALMVPGQDHVHMGGTGISIRPGVEHYGGVALAGERVGRGQTGRTASNYGNIDEFHRADLVLQDQYSTTVNVEKLGIREKSLEMKYIGTFSYFSIYLIHFTGIPHR